MNNIDGEQLTSHQLNYMCLSLFKNELNMLWSFVFEFLLEEPAAVLVFAELIDLWHKALEAYIGKPVSCSLSARFTSRKFINKVRTNLRFHYYAFDGHFETRYEYWSVSHSPL